MRVCRDRQHFYFLSCQIGDKKCTSGWFPFSVPCSPACWSPRRLREQCLDQMIRRIRDACLVVSAQCGFEIRASSSRWKYPAHVARHQLDGPHPLIVASFLWAGVCKVSSMFSIPGRWQNLSVDRPCWRSLASHLYCFSSFDCQCSWSFCCSSSFSPLCFSGWEQELVHASKRYHDG